MIRTSITMPENVKQKFDQAWGLFVSKKKQRIPSYEFLEHLLDDYLMEASA